MGFNSGFKGLTNINYYHKTVEINIMKVTFNRSFYVCKVATGDYRHRREKARNVRTTARQYAVALPVSHRGGQSSIPGQSMWDSRREKSRK